MIKTEGLCRSFGKEKFQAVKDVTIDVKDGEVYGLLGPNGAGKTTLLRVLSALMSPTSGDATVNGYGIRYDKDGVRRSIGLLTETPQLYEDMTARENLEYIASFYHQPREKTSVTITRYLDDFGLNEHPERRVSKYSKGMKQKVALARCLVHDPPVLFLDEPTSGLDPVSAKKIKDTIRSLKKAGRTIVICTHNLYDATVLCDRISIMNHNILYTGKPTNPADLEDLYCKLLEEHGNGF